MHKALNYMSLAKKARLIELGEEPVGAAARAGEARLIVVASDASDHTWRRAKSFAAGTDQQCIRIDQTKDEMGMAIGRQELAIAAITEPSMALALVEAIGEPEKNKAAIEILAAKAAKLLTGKSAESTTGGENA